jgi:hypothetical protein
MKTLTLLLLSAALAIAQYSPVPSSSYPALDAVIDSKPAHRVQAGAPSGNCITGKDISTNTSNGDMYWCTSTNTWSKVQVNLGYTPESPLTFNTPLSRTANAVSCPTCATSGSFEAPLTFNTPLSRTSNTVSCPTCATSGSFEAPLTFNAPLSRTANAISCPTCALTGAFEVPLTFTGGLVRTVNSVACPNCALKDANGNLPLGDGTVSGGDVFFELTANGSNFAWLGAQDSMPANYGWGLPVAAPTPGTPYCIQFGASVNKTVGSLTVPVFPMTLVPCAGALTTTQQPAPQPKPAPK